MSTKRACINFPKMFYTGNEQSPLHFGLSAEGYDTNTLMEGYDKNSWVVEIKNNKKVWIRKDSIVRIVKEEPLIKDVDEKPLANEAACADVPPFSRLFMAETMAPSLGVSLPSPPDSTA